MSENANRAKEIFVAALKLAPDQWPAYLNEACGQDDALRNRVQNLLQAHTDAGSFLKPAAGGMLTIDGSAMERPGTVIGPYKLLQQIGEGGMGTVFMAEQEQPVRRMVALKIIKAGMDSRQIVARFEAERQALAMMDHPNIARVIDAGTIPDERRDLSPPVDRRADDAPLAGRPYFAMELIKGIPITRYCASLLAGLAGNDKSGLTAAEGVAFADQAIAALRDASKAGWSHPDRLTDADFDPLRDRQDFKKLLAEMQMKSNSAMK